MVRYGRVIAIFDVSFDVREGEIVTLLGSNGAGKTTTLKAISGVINPSRGEISFEGKSLAGLPPDRIVELGIAHVPEGRRVFPYLTVEENLYIGAVGRESWKRRKDTLERVFNIFPVLRERRSVQARLLSGGEQQMLVIGRGLMSRPRLLMLDEPSLGLAPKVIREVYKVLEGLRKEKVTILLAEQNAYYALKIADRGYVLENGRVILEGSSQELLNNELMKKAYLGV
jgi:branched-chain amino acid transport system ATP-binding protein